jgi:hypothetical protein
MTLADMVEHLRMYIDDRNSERYTADADLYKLLSRGQEEAQKQIDAVDRDYFSKCVTFSVVASTTDYEFDLPTDCKQIMVAERLGSGDPIPVKWTPFATRNSEGPSAPYPTVGAPGSPPTCYLRAGKFGIVKPDSAYDLRMFYIRRLQEFAAPTDVSEVPLEHHNYIVLHAALLSSASEDRGFEKWQREYDRELEGLRSFTPGRQKQEPRSVIYFQE